ncbi:Endonuclease, Uma2 family (restriction endonuclease fold) [Desulfosporosinus lacus DSM 15449]|uniref:Endonuclease, Uma2 family (Restriction endonuclease fold) n=2 Tax=Desulfosporosinus TaxID=79206 RepID=A0A1M5ZR66_9FIRM|nr:Endonuclease, Uma2 family (restriction endonuclease fold) [Desulfosporosinus lacus DSM 15449]
MVIYRKMKGEDQVMSLPEENKKHTYSDYLTWPEKERWEIIDGVPYLQSAPKWQHQSISGELYRQISNYLIDKPCRVFASPFDLCLVEYEESDDDILNIVQPDIVIVCDETKLRKTGYFGVPALIIEISSPSTTRQDRVIKFNKYEKVGVKEYWIVEPDGKYISVFTLQENKRYGRPEAYTEKDKAKMSVFSDFTVDLKPVFEGI